MVKTAGGVHALGYKIIIFTVILPYFRFQHVRIKQANKALSLRLKSMLPTWLVLLCTDSLGDSGGVILWSRPRYLHTIFIFTISIIFVIIIGSMTLMTKNITMAMVASLTCSPQRCHRPPFPDAAAGPR